MPSFEMEIFQCFFTWKNDFSIIKMISQIRIRIYLVSLYLCIEIPRKYIVVLLQKKKSESNWSADNNCVGEVLICNSRNNAHSYPGISVEQQCPM